MKRESTIALTEYVKNWGNAHSIVLLDRSCNHFSIPSLEGIIAYRLKGNAAVVMGDPICPSQEMPQLVQAFQDFCTYKKKRPIYVSVSQEFMEWALAHHCHSAVQVGSEIILDPRQDPRAKAGHYPSLLRNKCNHAARENIVIKEYTQKDERVERAIEQIARAWVKNRRGPQVYLLAVEVFEGRENKRWFYAEQNGHILGVLYLNELQAKKGWVLNMLMLAPDAPTYISEVIVLYALEVLAKEGYTYFTVGTMPAPYLGNVLGVGSVTQAIIRMMFFFSKKMFHLEERQRYWKKFYPTMLPTYALFSEKNISLSEVLGIIKAFNVRF